jgi:tRNA (guanine37-N1)-methyltransferase
MRFDVLTIFPNLVMAPLSDSIVRRARTTGALAVAAHDLRGWTDDVHRTVDDTPYGGGAGMVMKVDPIVRAAESITGTYGKPDRTLVMAASGRRFEQSMARQLASLEHVLIICGHYEGIDARVNEILGAEDVSIGDYVLTGGEIPAAVIIDTVARLLPGVIKSSSTEDESHSNGLLEYPQYTRPADYRGFEVPEILLGGNHASIARWRADQSRLRTVSRRPDLLTHPDSDPTQT